MKTDTNILPPAGIEFTDNESRDNYLRAYNKDLNDFHPKPFTLITSTRPASGKTRLAKHILDHRYSSHCAVQHPANEHQWGEIIPPSIKRGYLFLDNAISPINSPSLVIANESPVFQYLKLGEKEPVTIESNLQVIITGNHLQVSEDIARRALWIHLK